MILSVIVFMVGFGVFLKTRGDFIYFRRNAFLILPVLAIQLVNQNSGEKSLYRFLIACSEVIFVAFLILGINFIFKYFDARKFWNFACLGFGLLVSIALFQFVLNFFSPLPWYGVNEKLTVAKLTGGYRFQPIANTDSYISQYFGVQGPGLFEYSVETRSRKRFNIRYAVNHNGKKSQVYSKICKVKIDWTICKISTTLISNGKLQVVLGGENTWSERGLWIEVKPSAYRVPTSQLAVRMSNYSRESIFSENANLFASWLVVIAFLLFESLRGWAVLVPLFFGILGLLITQSRSGLLSMILSVSFSLKAKSKFVGRKTNIILNSVVTLFIILALPLFLRLNFLQSGYSDRKTLYLLMLDAFLKFPVFGNITEFAKILNQLELNHSHSIIFQVLVQYGVFGALLWCILLYTIFFKIILLGRYSRIGTILVVIILNIFDYTFFYGPLRLAFLIVINDLENK